MALIWKRQDQDDEFFTVKPGGGQGPTVTRGEEPFVKMDPSAAVPEVAAQTPQPLAEGQASVQTESTVQESQEEPAQKPSGLFGRFKSALGQRLERTKSEFVGKIKEVIKAAGVVDEHLIDKIEEILIQADVGAETTMRIVDEMKEFEARGASPDELLKSFKSQLHDIVGTEQHKLAVANKPHVFLVIGVNGVGKTTTIGKLAAEYRRQGKKTMIVAGDTFRAAAVDQLKIWANRTGSTFISKGMGSDPAGTAFDGIKQAVDEGYDVVLVDTAGRLHTKTNLMEELKKIVRVSDRVLPGAPQSTLLVLDATTGQNAISQAKVFSEAIPVSGIVMTKLDGTAKGGVLIGIRNLFPIPVVKIGVGEGVDDLRDFNPKEFVDALFEE
jgi:fused signal recognition particle receptor